MTEAHRLLLWDIDQTLIEAGGVTKRAYARVFHEATGMPLRQPWQFDGRTELAAVTQVLRDHEIEPAEALVDLFITRIVHELQERADELTNDGRVLPGATEALRACAAQPGVRQSVLTGNLYHLAVLKLTLFHLAEYLDLRIGGFGDDALDRSDLVAHAWRRAEEHLGQRFTGHDTIIIGDTLRDIAAARRVGARAVAVATGTYRPAQLRAAGADWVLPNLASTPAVLQAIFGTTSRS